MYRTSVMALTAVVLPSIALAQQSPWERAANNLALTFTGPLARSLALVAIVIGGLMFMFGEGGAKRQISGIVFGGGLAPATFNLFYSFLAGVLIFVGLYGFGLWATRRDPQMLGILLSSPGFKARYDAAKHDPVTVEVRRW
jgi:type IV secretory pathway VirB2 component (pilin)